ncbi:MAG TPA: hypothetical protein VJ249_07825 [Candidatus Bathyarchaeia archaeon]|nr:hypothetical protein [Candidatus Bathyarchaeia archaeon]
MKVENAVIEKVDEAQAQAPERKQEAEKPANGSGMKAVLMKKGEYHLSNSIVLPSLDLCLIGEQDTILVPGDNVLPILGVGNKDIKCSKCGYILAMKIKRPQLQNLAIKCPSCGSVNRF